MFVFILYIEININKKVNAKTIKYFLVVFSNTKIKNIDNRYKTKGILFPEKTIAVKKYINIKGKIKYIIFLYFVKKSGIIKKEKRENL